MNCPLTLIARAVHEERILKSRPVLQPTGCTAQFCQAGRLNRPLEPYVGENRPLSSIKVEAEAFLYEMYDEGLFNSQDDFDKRVQEVIAEIDAGVLETKVWEDSQEMVDGVIELKRVQIEGASSKGWLQTREELEWGIRVAWRNSRKCIMRAHYEDLKLFDLRDITTSKGMLDAIIQKLPEAYNGGRIQPSVFMFPSRSVDGLGPVFWSPQLLTFAAYTLPNGEILGDPSNVQITKDIIELGWIPSEPKSRWDILPIVAMAEGDEPAWAVLPLELTELIPIRHPGYVDTFNSMGLKWCKFPALSKLGFDIGGVQYTAAPFIGWFMDAEIGVRDLADTFRYNVLPDVIEAIGWNKKDIEFEDLPDSEKLLWMSKAQAELCYAVHYSFSQAGVTCISTLAASESWCAFDDQHLKDKGYRLNADPYWIAPPQGSIIPLWHRGAAPNYQPKPLIAKHRYDPVKAWKKRKGTLTEFNRKGQLQAPLINIIEAAPGRGSRIYIFYSGTRGTSSKLAEKLRRRLQTRQPPKTPVQVSTLNSISPSKLRPNDTILVIISTTGHGQIPSNGQQFLSKMASLCENLVSSLRFSIFGVGDSGYQLTFNAAAMAIEQAFLKIGASPVGSVGVFKSDVALEDPPLSAFQSWWKRIDPGLDNSLSSAKFEKDEDDIHGQDFTVFSSYKEGSLHINKRDHAPGRTIKLSLEIQSSYQDMSHIRLLPRNGPQCVAKVISLLGMNDGSTKITLPHHQSNTIQEITVREFLTHYVDLSQPFRCLNWVKSQYPNVDAETKNTSVIKFLEEILQAVAQAPPTTSNLFQILFSMPAQNPRCYSIASSSTFSQQFISSQASNHTKSIADILVKIIPNGRFSSQSLSDLQNGDKIRYSLAKVNITLPLLDLTDKPLIAVTCGTGFGPIRSLIQRRVQQAMHMHSLPLPITSERIEGGNPSKMTLFLGFKIEDRAVFIDTLREASQYDIFDSVYMVPSNEEKLRVQGRFEDCKEALVRKLGEQGGWLYVCGAKVMVKGVREKMMKVLGVEVWESLGKRYIEETI